MLRPCLKHQHVPKMLMPITFSTLVLLPFLSNRSRTKYPLLHELSWVKKLLSPLTEWPSKPRRYGNSESRLRLIEEPSGHILGQNLPQDPLTLPFPYFHAQRQTPSELDDTMVEYGHPCLEAYSHARSIDLGKDVIGKVAPEISKHESVGGIFQGWARSIRHSG